MNEPHSLTTSLRRVVLPLVIAAVLVLATVLISGSVLLRIEDVTVNRILAGTYGDPDWRVQDMNPLLAQTLALLYRILPAVNWYGVLLLALLFLSVASILSLAARKRGGLIPAALIVSPLVILLANSVVSTCVTALCAVAGAYSLMDGLQRRRDGIARAIWGGVLFFFAVMLSLPWAVLLTIGAVLCWLPFSIRDTRLRGLVLGVPIMVILVSALFGYSALLYQNPELSAYREHYALYERVLHSDLKDESDRLLDEYGQAVMSASHADHAHEETEAATPVDIPESHIFGQVGWTINDASLFFTRFGSDTKLTDPETLRILDEHSSNWNFSPGRLFSELFATIKKPQFLLLIGLYVFTALLVLLSSRGKGLIVLLASLIAFGGHVVTIAHYYDAFADIAPFYLLGIMVLLFFFDGDGLKAFLGKLSAGWLRIIICAIVSLGFVAASFGMLYYLRVTPVNIDMYTLDAVGFLKPYIAENQDMLYIGDNPNERYKPDTLAAPKRGEDKTLLAGSYDLYSPRYMSMMEAFGIENPLPDSVDRDDIGYVTMGFTEAMTYRLASEYELYVKDKNTVFEEQFYAESIFTMSSYTIDELEAIRQTTQTAAGEQPSDDTAHDHAEDDAHDHDHSDEEDHEHSEDEHAQPEGT